jgi:hypothetical protein
MSEALQGAKNMGDAQPADSQPMGQSPPGTFKRTAESDASDGGGPPASQTQDAPIKRARTEELALALTVATGARCAVTHAALQTFD